MAQMGNCCSWPSSPRSIFKSNRSYKQTDVCFIDLNIIFQDYPSFSRTMEDIPPCSRLYISLGSGFNPTNLRELAESYGRVEEFKAPRKTNAKGEVRQRGFAFVKFFKTSDAAAALEGLDGTEFENLTLKVSVAGTQRSEAGHIVNIIPRYLFFT